MFFKKHWKTLEKHSHTPFLKIIIYGLTAVFAVIAIVVFLNTYVYNSRASQTGLNISFSPNQATIKSNAGTSTNVQLFAMEGSDIVGFDLRLGANGPVQIVSIGSPKALGNPNVQFTELVHTTNRIYAIVQGSQTASSIYIPVQVKSLPTTGMGTISVDTAHTQVVGHIAGYEFALNTLNKFIVTVQNNLHVLPGAQ